MTESKRIHDLIDRLVGEVEEACQEARDEGLQEGTPEAQLIVDAERTAKLYREQRAANPVVKEKPPTAICNVGQFRAAFADCSDASPIVFQVVGEESGAWNLGADVCRALVPGRGHVGILCVSLSHPQLKRLPMDLDLSQLEEMETEEQRLTERVAELEKRVAVLEGLR